MPVHKTEQSSKNINPWMIFSFLLLIGLLIKMFADVDIKIKPKSQNPSQQATPAGQSAGQPAGSANADFTQLEKKVLPASGVELPIAWGDLGQQLVNKGVIDKTKLEQLFSQGGKSMSEEDRKILEGADNKSLRMTRQNSQYLLDLLWAFGLANKNDILDKGEMMQDPKQVGNFASTGGWTLGKGKAIDYYSRFQLVKLTPEQQVLVDKVSQGIYRPCCGNSTHFPDCNHGMAMLGLLELMAANGVNESQMYKTALTVNSFWFPQTYIELAAYFAEQGKSWDQVDPKEVLGGKYSSAQGYKQTRSQTKSLPQIQQGGGGCGA